MILLMWVSLGALAGIAVLCGIWAAQAIRRDLAEERADREAQHVARHARVPQVHHDEYGRRGQPQNDGRQRAGLAGRVGFGLPPVATPEFLPAAPREDRPAPTPPVGAGPTIVPGRATTPAGEPAPRLASVAPGPESEPSGATVPAPATPAMRVCSSEQVTWRDDDPLGPADCGDATRAATRHALGLSGPVDAPPPGPTWQDHLAALQATLAELAKPSDEEQFPHLAPAWQDSTGTFTAICGGA